jgi:LuxR family maltose regulon positive regulatory protein
MQRDQLLKTKLYIPRRRPDLVARPRLTQRLQDGAWLKLTLVSAPAGFGKTTLLSEWIHQNDLRAAWISLDKADNDPRRFLSYLVAALQTVQPGLAQHVLTWLQMPQLAAYSLSSDCEWVEDGVTALVNEIAVRPDGLVLILDDYHAIESDQVHAALRFLVEHAPPQMHLVIATRSEPPLPLSRLRARRQMNELHLL